MSERDHGRKVRGGQSITSSRDEKRGRRERKSTERLHRETETGGGNASGSSPLMDPGDVLDRFVQTDETERVRRRVQRWLSVERPVHLVGPTGCGKTALAMHAAEERGRPVVWLNGDADLTTSDLVGEYGATERVSVRDKYVHNVMKSKDVVQDRWVDNALTVAVREGATLVYNEFSRTKPETNNVLLSVLEEGVLELPGHRGEDRYVEVHPEFRTILTSNSAEYAGVHEPQDALLDRLVGIHMEFYDRETEVEIVDAHVGDDLPRAHVELAVDVVRELREELDIDIGTRAGIMAAEGLTTVSTTAVDAELIVQICTEVVASKVGRRDRLEAIRSHVAAIVDERGVPER